MMISERRRRALRQEKIEREVQRRTEITRSATIRKLGEVNEIDRAVVDKWVDLNWGLPQVASAIINIIEKRAEDARQRGGELRLKRPMAIPTDWTFRDSGVADDFERHVREQLPWYDLVSGAIVHFARHYLPDAGLVYDVGASTGNFAKLAAPTINARRARLVAIESSPEMAAKYRTATPRLPGELMISDALAFNYQPFDLAVLNLVVMFVPVKARRDYLSKLYALCRPGGAIILVDKVENPGGYFGTASARLTLAGKISTGTSPADVVAKELSIAGVQRPLEPRLIDMMFGSVAREFFRFGEFVGWVIEADGRGNVLALDEKRR